MGSALANQRLLPVSFCHQQCTRCLLSRGQLGGLWAMHGGGGVRLFALQVEPAHVRNFERWWEKPGAIGLIHACFVAM